MVPAPPPAPETILAGFVSSVEVVLGVATVVLAVRALRRPRDGPREQLEENRLALVILLAGTLAAIGALAWPLLYLTLDSYVPRWPGVMCIQGVTGVGRGSAGPAGWLPGLLTTLSILRPAAVFVAGAWIALHLANRRTRTAPLTRRLLAVLALAGVVSISAGLVELAYLSIPKAERFLATGCCTAPPGILARGAGLRPLGLIVGGEGGRRAAALFFGGGAVMAAATAWFAFGRGAASPRRGGLLVLALAAAGFVVVGAAFVSEAASPAILHLPHHRCAWCLLSSAPECIVGVALFLGAVFAVGWAATVAWAAGAEESRASAAGQIRSLLLAALFGMVASLLLAAIEMSLA